jgi:hypothetical protein
MEAYLIRRNVRRSLSQIRRKLTRLGLVIFAKISNCNIMVIPGFLFTKKIIKNTMKAEKIAGYVAAALVLFSVQLIRLGKTRVVGKEDWAKMRDDAARRVQRQGGVGKTALLGKSGGGGMAI